jgi:uncharacterized membrane protein
MEMQPTYQGQILPGGKSRLDNWMQKVGVFVTEYWAWAITSVLGIVMLLACSVPFLEYFGLDNIAKPIFYALHMICAQIPAHSFYFLGHQFGMCARNISIYGSMFATSLAFSMTKKRLPGIPWPVWLILILPMSYDGLTQMFGLRESTWELRVLTGTLFGMASVWFALPLIQKTLTEAVPTHHAK